MRSKINCNWQNNIKITNNEIARIEMLHWNNCNWQKCTE